MQVQAAKTLKELTNDYEINSIEPEPTSNPCDDEDASAVETFEEELAKYRLFDKFDTEKDEILKFWYDRQIIYPRLASAAKRLLGYPASSASAERTFSKARLLVTDYRSSLKTETIKGCMLGSCF